MTYKLCPKNKEGNSTAVLHKARKAFIPFDENNVDYQEYLEWVDAGNTPEAAD